MLLLERLGIEAGAVPIDTTGAAVAGDYVSLKNFERVVILIMQGAWAGGTPAVTLLQATDVAASGAKALAFDAKYSKTGISNTQWTKAAVTSNTFNLAATPNIITAIEVKASDLDVAGGFDCVRVNVATPGANADLIAVAYILGDAKSRLAILPAATVD